MIRSCVTGVLLFGALALVEAAGRPPRPRGGPSRKAPSKDSREPLDGPVFIPFGDGTRLARIDEPPGEGFDDEAAKILEDAAKAHYYVWHGGPPVGERRGKWFRCFLYTVTTNLAESTDFGAAVRSRIEVLGAEERAAIVCHLTEEGDWRGIVRGRGRMRGPAADAWHRLIGNRPGKVQWAFVVGGPNDGVWFACRFREVKAPALRDLVAQHHPRPRGVTVWRDTDGTLRVFQHDMLTSFHRLLRDDLSKKALSLPKGATP
ncbi:MAG: hypothetical protein ACLF0G_00695 [Candidatus Brocadiia bacterium]